MSLLQKFWPACQEIQSYENNEFQVGHRLRDVYGINIEVIWLWQLFGCLEVFLFEWV